MAIVIARPSPMARVLSKKTVSPTPIAATIETTSKTNVAPDIVTRAAGPFTTTTQASSSVPATPERIALMATEPWWGISVRASRLVIDQARAAPRAHRAPRAGCGGTGVFYHTAHGGPARARAGRGLRVRRIALF